jgi:hypothetical protein
MKSTKNIVIGIIVIVVLIVVGYIVRSKQSPSDTSGSDVTAPTSEAQPGTPVAVSETTKVSGSFSEYQNAELGFSVKYPSDWDKEEGNAGVTFVIPIDKTQVSTVKTLQAVIQAYSGQCAFPPVPTIKDRGTITAGGNTFNMIYMLNTVQSRTYTNRMYSLQQGNVCYIFSFSAIAASPSSSGFTGSNAIQAENNNKAIVTTADSDFTSMVKSFGIVTTPAGQDESTVAPK